VVVGEAEALAADSAAVDSAAAAHPEAGDFISAPPRTNSAST
jgi:hypothetical protein